MTMIKNGYRNLLVILWIGLAAHAPFLAGVNRTEPEVLTYYLEIAYFGSTFIEIPTSNVDVSSPVVASSYLAGRAPIYNLDGVEVGTCSASFLNMQTTDIFTDISNYLVADNGLIVTWFTPTTLANLALDTIINGMVTECTVTVTTKVGASTVYGQNFSLVVSSSGGRIYFQFTRIGTIF